MKDHSIWTVIKTVATIFLTYTVWWWLIVVGGLLIAADIALNLYLLPPPTPPADDTVISFLTNCWHVSQNAFPFAEILRSMFEDMFEGKGILFSIVDLATDQNRPDLTIAWADFASDLMKDLTVLSIAELIYFIFKKFKGLFRGIRSCLFRLMLVVCTPLWVCASFFTADAVVLLADCLVGPRYTGVSHIILFLAAAGIHIVSLAFASKKRIWVKAMVILLQFGIDAIRAISAWLWFGSLVQVFRFQSLLSMLEYGIVAIVSMLLYWIFDKIEDPLKKAHDSTYARDIL